MADQELPLGNTALMREVAAPECKKCGFALRPVVFFGQIISWKCDHCNPHKIEKWSK